MQLKLLKLLPILVLSYGKASNVLISGTIVGGSGKDRSTRGASPSGLSKLSSRNVNLQTKTDLSGLSTLKNEIESTDLQCILCDIDGTFIRDDHSVSEGTIDSIKSLRERGVLFFPATGRTRKSMMDVTDNVFTNVFDKPIHQIPGVYAQGLTVYGENGYLIHEAFLEPEVIRRVESFCESEGLALIAYAGDSIFCKKQCMQTNKITDYAEPRPEEFPAGLCFLKSEAGTKVNKVIVLAQEEILLKVRPKLQAFIGQDATLTRAVPGMLEVLPYGASKGDGVQRLLDYYQVSAANTIAFGDGENDIEMMQLVGLSVAMENAKPILKEVCAASTLSNNDSGVGHVLSMILEALDNKQ